MLLIIGMVLKEMFIEFWRKKFDMEVRDIATGDINNDGIDEVLVASWDGKIYVFNPNKMLWSSKGAEYPAENIELIFDSFSKARFVVGSFHRKIIAYDLDGKELWEKSLDSWITHLLKTPVTDGFEKIIAVDLHGKITVLEAEGEIRCVIKPNMSGITPVVIADSDELIVGTKKGDLVFYDFDGNELLRKKIVNSEILSLDAYRDFVDNKYIVIGHEYGISIFDGGSSQIVQTIRLKDQSNFSLIKACYTNMRSELLLVAGSWVGDKINILRFDKAKNKFYVVKQLALDGNPLYVDCEDLNGDYVEEIILLSDGGFMEILDSKSFKLIGKIEAQPNLHGFAIGNTTGLGGKEIIFRATREILSGIGLVPRISIEFAGNFEHGILRAFTPSGAKIEGDKTISLLADKRKYMRKVINKRSFSYYEYPFTINYRGRLIAVKISGRGGLSFVARVPVPASSNLIDEFNNVVALAEEDIVRVKSFKVEANSRVMAENLIVHNIERSDGGTIFYVSFDKISNVFKSRIKLESSSTKTKHKEDVSKELVFIVWPLRTIDIELKNLSPVMSTEDKVLLNIKNNSRKSIPIEILGRKPLFIKFKHKLNPLESREVSLKLEIKDQSPIINIKSSIIIRYGEYRKHQVGIPVSFRLLNAEIIRQRARKMYIATKDQNLVIKTLSAELGVDEGYIKRLVNL